MDATSSTWMLVHSTLGERKLDYYALQNSFASRLNIGEHLMLRKSHGTAADLLDDSPPLRRNAPTALCAPPVYVKPEATPFLYKTHDGDESDDGDDFAEHEYGFGEYDYRHPGTNWDSDDEDERGDNDIFSPIATKAGQELGSILFAAEAGKPSCELKAAYKLQLCVRFDEKRLALIYDCFEYKGAALAPSDPLPSNRSMRRFEEALHMKEPRGGWSGGYGSSEEEEDDDDDPLLDEPCEPTRELDEAGRVAIQLQGHVGDFMASRVLRLRLPLASICGVRIHSPGLAVDGLPDAEARALLVLEFETPPDETAFAARKIGSQHHGDKEFATVTDWTPDQAASVATRHYISGGAREIKQLAAHLASLSARLARMLERPTATAASHANSLAPPTLLAVTATPSHRVYSVAAATEDVNMPSLQSLSARAAIDVGASAKDAQDAGYPSVAVSALAAAESHKAAEGKLSCDKVHKLMVERLGLTSEEAEMANPCFKRAVLLGHIVLSETTTQETVVCRGTCICCSTTHAATIADVLDQPVYGGNDYEDGGQEGAVQCEECCGMYVTGLCIGRPSFDSGKFHNHCVECPDFGQCIGDYREAHCTDCGKHYFCGMSGFACSHCGGGDGRGRKSKPLSQLPPPPPSAFDGVLVGAADKIREQLPSMNPFKRMIMESLLLGAGYTAAAGGAEETAADSCGMGSGSGTTRRGGSSRLTPDADQPDMMMGMMAAMAGGAEGLPPLPPELLEQMAGNPEAMMAMLSMMIGGHEDDDEASEEAPPQREGSKAAGKSSRKTAAKKPRRGGGGGSSGSGGGVSAEFAY